MVALSIVLYFFMCGSVYLLCMFKVKAFLMCGSHEYSFFSRELLLAASLSLDFVSLLHFLHSSACCYVLTLTHKISVHASSAHPMP